MWRKSGWRRGPSGRYDITPLHALVLARLSQPSCAASTSYPACRSQSFQCSNHFCRSSARSNILYLIPVLNFCSHHPHVTIMAEVVPQVTLTKALTNNTSAPSPKPAPPAASSAEKKADHIDNEGAWSFAFIRTTWTCKARSSML
jgi:hypothetical protein